MNGVGCELDLYGGVGLDRERDGVMQQPGLSIGILGSSPVLLTASCVASDKSPSLSGPPLLL